MAPTEKSVSRVPRQIGDCVVLPLTLPAHSSLPTTEPTTHYCYVKPDTPREPSNTTPRSLFISNVPIDSTEDAFRTLFKSLHPSALVERVDFEDDADAQAPLRVLKDLGLQVGSEVQVQGTKMVSQGYGAATNAGAEVEVNSKKRKRELAEDAELLSVAKEMTFPSLWTRSIRKSGSSAVVVFVDRSSMLLGMKAIEQRAKSKSKSSAPLHWVPEQGGLGSERYKAHNKLIYPSPSSLLSSVTTYLNAFTALEQQRSKLLKTQGAVADADGFITVSRGAGRSAPAARIEDAQAAQEKLKEREKKRIGGDFYRFQSREGRKQKERALRDGFEEDRRRVMEMRARRGKVRPEQ